MIEDAGLALGDAVAGGVGAEMPPMAGEEDGGIGIEKASHFGVQHRQQGGGNGLIRQTNF